MKKKLGNNGEPIESEEYRDIKLDEMKEKPQPQEAWEDKLYDIFCDSVRDNKSTYKEVKPFISQLLEAQQGKLYAWFNKALLKQKKEWMDVSSWRNLGEKYGYFKFFENKIKKEIIEECLEVLNHSIGKDDAYKEILKLLKN